MAVPDWFDPLLRIPTPRRVVPSSALRQMRFGLAAAIGFSPLTFIADKHGPFFMLGMLSMIAVFFLLLIDAGARASIPSLRSGVASIARIVPRETTLGDVGAAVANALMISAAASQAIDYEYGTAQGVQRGKARLNSNALARRGLVFPEGAGVGARFVVLVDPQRPSKHSIYGPGGFYRIAPPSE